MVHRLLGARLFRQPIVSFWSIRAVRNHNEIQNTKIFTQNKFQNAVKNIGYFIPKWIAMVNSWIVSRGAHPQHSLITTQRLLISHTNLNKVCGMLFRSATNKAQQKHFGELAMLMKHPDDDVIKWKHFPLYWPFVRGIHRSPVNSQRPLTRRFDVFFALRLNKRWSKQW